MYRGICRRTLLPAGIKGGYSYYELKPSGANYGYCVYAVYRGSITTAYRISEINRTVCIWPQPILPREGHVRSAVVVSGDLGTRYFFSRDPDPTLDRRKLGLHKST